VDKSKYNLRIIRERINFLSQIRQLAVDPLFLLPWDLAKTKVIFINDIIYNFYDIIKLIDTNDQNYDAVCGLDFYVAFYDTWVSIELKGESFGDFFPYLHNPVGQEQVVKGKNVRVLSCWNGVIVFNGNSLLDVHFKYSPNNDLSECTIFHLDLWKKDNQLVIVNPNLIFAYEYHFYYLQKYYFPYTHNVLSYFYYYFAHFFDSPNLDYLSLTKELTYTNIQKLMVKEFDFFEKKLK